jgi:hypothetical protein
VTRELRGATDRRASTACKWLFDKAVGAGELQRAGCWLQFRSNALQTARRVKVFQPFTWIAGAAMLKAGYHKRGIEG